MARDAADSKTNLMVDLLYPLDAVYAAAGLTVPDVSDLPGPEMPQPYRDLLVHQGDMTPALERFHKATIHLQVRSARINAGTPENPKTYLREVVLLLDGSETPVEYGAIIIHLNRFSPEARKEIVEGRRPLGTIMREQNVTHLSRPRAFLRIEADAHIANALNVAPGSILYGRRNRLLTLEGHALADIVEILPQSPDASGEETSP